MRGRSVGKRRAGAVDKAPSKVPRGKARLNIVLEEDLKRWVQRYAERNKTTVTYIIHATFVKLRRGDTGIEVLDDDIMEWAKGYALKHHTTVQDMVTRLLVDLRKEESGTGVKQI
jgi:hypothetical protein